MANSDYTILVVDDDENNLDMLSRRLERKEYKVLTASDGPDPREEKKKRRRSLLGHHGAHGYPP
jgi:CheY-like chemotaxis protein